MESATTWPLRHYTSIACAATLYRGILHYCKPPNINKLPTLLESMNIHEASLLGTSVKKSFIVCPVMLADGDMAIGGHISFH
jgi:hypothetical protein